MGPAPAAIARRDGAGQGLETRSALFHLHRDLVGALHSPFSATVDVNRWSALPRPASSGRGARANLELGLAGGARQRPVR
jgi:hypothetical protein